MCLFGVMLLNTGNTKNADTLNFVAPVSVQTTPSLRVAPMAPGIGPSMKMDYRPEAPKSVGPLQGVMDAWFATGEKEGNKKYPIMADESVMSPKAHGTTETPVQDNLRWAVDQKVADNICSFNRHYAEFGGYWQTVKPFIEEAVALPEGQEITFYDSVSGKPLFVAPRGRSMKAFLEESMSHGWPSFRDEEVVWDNMRCVKGGEAVSVDGTHLGHNLPDLTGNRYCINLVSVAGRPKE